MRLQANVEKDIRWRIYCNASKYGSYMTWRLL